MKEEKVKLTLALKMNSPIEKKSLNHLKEF